MSNQKQQLHEMFTEKNRFDNFGEVLTRIHIRGFRCHKDTRIEINSPITAICGLNGTGKSTVLQLATCAYNPHPLRSYYIKNFLFVSKIDPNPFSKDAYVEFTYSQKSRFPRSRTISRTDQTKRWKGYAHRPWRYVFLAGITFYLPKAEQKDFIVRESEKFSVLETSRVDEKIRFWTERILGQSYDSMSKHTVRTYRSTELVSVERSGIGYSEIHMGFGEARIQALVRDLEALPDKSLILMEEPETSLHPSAQHVFAEYLIDVVTRKRHQILLTTHSEFILGALPSQSRIYLHRNETGIQALPGLSALQAKSLMTLGNVKALHILTEDKCSREVLKEIIRTADPLLLKTVAIHPAGDANIVRNVLKSLKPTGLPVIGVRDADKGESPIEGIFKLPGSLPPEQEIFNNETVKNFLSETYNIRLEDIMVNFSEDHHDWISKLAEYINEEETALLNILSKVYAKSLPNAVTDSLVKSIRDAVSRL